MLSPPYSSAMGSPSIAIPPGLFLIQRHGTDRLGVLFGPVILVWLGFLAVTGAVDLARTPQVLWAVSPLHAIRRSQNGHI